MMEVQQEVMESFSLHKQENIGADVKMEEDDLVYFAPEGDATLAQQLNEITDFNDTGGIESCLDQESPPDSLPHEGIEASDIGSLFEQFLEYEQGSDLEICSYPDSSMVTPVESLTPIESVDISDDTVLGRLMIVQEKLNQEVAISNDKDVDNNNFPRIDGLMRTVNGIHPKGDNIRMADSPKFAKFKKKRSKQDPPLRRCVSGSTTPRCTSPSDIVTPEEMKRREAKLIEALALTFPKQNQQAAKSGSIDKVKRNLSKANTKPSNGVVDEPLTSRMMPVVSKRNRKSLPQVNGVTDPRLNSPHADPRLNKVDYGENSNIMNLKNTKLIKSSTNNDSGNTADTSIVDMTICHDTLTGSIIVQQTVTPQKQVIEATTIETAIEPGNNDVSQNDKESILIPSADKTLNSVSTITTSTETSQDSMENIEIKTEPLDDISECKEETETATLGNTSTLKNTKVRSGSVKPPRNYRRVNNFNPELSDSENEKPHKRKRKRSTSSRTSRSPYRKSQSPVSRSHSRSSSIPRSPDYYSKRPRRSRSRSRSLYSREHSRSPSYSRRNGTRSRSRSRTKSSSRERSLSGSPHERSQRKYSSSEDSEKIDISSKLSELANPVPYDIEHERKVRFLTGNATRGNVERRNIYAGGIDKHTTKGELAERFHRFGRIEKITLHFREKGDNYAFIVFDEPDNAMRAIEEGNDDTGYPKLELCFGGRRKFVGGSYVDFDGNNEYLEEKEIQSRCESPEDDFDRLLKMAMHSKKKREKTPEWT